MPNLANAELLKARLRFVGDVPPEGDDPIIAIAAPGFNMARFKNSCGIPRCIGGHVESMSIRPYAMSHTTNVATFLDILHYQAENLCFPGREDCSEENHPGWKATVEQACIAIDRVCDGMTPWAFMKVI